MMDVVSDYNERVALQRHSTLMIQSYMQSLEKLDKEKDIINSADLALKAAKPLLSFGALEECVKLSNLALCAIFEENLEVKFSPEEGAFVLCDGGNETVISEAEGGGLIAIVSLILDIYMIMKLNKRRFLVFDEHFYGVSEMYFDNFMNFLRKLCSDLNFDILLISHDKRIVDELVDHVYEIKDGYSIKQK